MFDFVPPHAAPKLAPLALLAGLLLATPALAGEITVPVDVGVGPAYYLGPGPQFTGTSGHFGLKLSVAAILDKETIRKNIKRVPKQYRAMVKRSGEIRYGPSIFIPDSLIISPALGDTGMYGITWRPVGLNVPLVRDGVRLDLSAGLLLTTALLHSTRFDTTFFLRPGIDLGLRLEVPLTDTLLVSFGAFAQFYIPQMPGEFGMGNTDDPNWLSNTIWLMPQAFMMVHYRFPYTVKL